MSPPKRKGALRRADVPPHIKQQLERGELETATLAESLVVDQGKLLANVLPDVGLQRLVPDVQAALAAIKTPTTMKTLYVVGETLAERVPLKPGPRSAFQKLARHRSDCVRCWAAMLIGFAGELSLADRFAWIRPFAADGHFGVREIAWLAVRPRIAEELELALELLEPWVEEEDPNLRRFASEVTRPRGVWCRHIEALKTEPAQALPLLQPLCSDSSKYVRDSVGNWLNDAGKTAPEWVRQLCRRWQKTSPTSETAYITRRALRNL